MQPSVLFVDDERSICSALKRTFRQHRFTVHTAHSGQEALTILDNNSVDVIVSDQRMPGMSGTELLSIVKQQFPRMGRIMLSGQSNTKDLIQAINEAQVEHFIPKPWNAKELVQVVKEALPPQSDNKPGTSLLPLQNVVSLEGALIKKQVKLECALKNSELELSTHSYRNAHPNMSGLNQLQLHWPNFTDLHHRALINLADQSGYLHDLLTWYLISIIDETEFTADNNQQIIIDLFSPLFLHSTPLKKLLKIVLAKEVDFTFLIPYEYLIQTGIYPFFDIVKHHRKTVALNIGHRVIDVANLDIAAIKYIALDGKIASMNNRLLHQKRFNMLSEINSWGYKSLLIDTQEAKQLDYAKKIGFDYY
jgi:DNA-binding response OmpR family regulator